MTTEYETETAFCARLRSRSNELWETAVPGSLDAAYDVIRLINAECAARNRAIYQATQQNQRGPDEYR